MDSSEITKNWSFWFEFRVWDLGVLFQKRWLPMDTGRVFFRVSGKSCLVWCTIITCTLDPPVKILSSFNTRVFWKNKTWYLENKYVIFYINVFQFLFLFFLEQYILLYYMLDYSTMRFILTPSYKSLTYFLLLL